MGETSLEKFRSALYKLFSKRRDAIFELMDALSSYGHRARSIVELSEALCFTRKYSSITDAIGDGMPFAQKDEIAQLVFDSCTHEHKGQYHLFALDVTAQPRLHAKTLKDRSIVHAPTYTPGQKPIALGHQYSTIVWLPQEDVDKAQHWVVPMSAERVPTDTTGHAFGMRQLTDMIVQLKLADQLIVSVGDTAYGAESCRQQGLSNDNIVHLFRMRNNRTIYCRPAGNSHKKYGDTMVLSNSETHGTPNDKMTKTLTTARGKHYQATISRWNNLLLRGSRKFKAYQHPLDLIQVILHPIDSEGNLGESFKKPMWLAVQGKRRQELSSDTIYQSYSQRFDIEHFFRFGKTRLLLDRFQTPDSEHEESHWFLCMLAYVQLYLGRHCAELHLKDWEKYNNKYANMTQATPTQVQRSFNTILSNIGTPALQAKPRGRPVGRKRGDSVFKRPEEKIIFKGKSEDDQPKIKLSGFEKQPVSSNLQKLATAVKTLPRHLHQLGFSLLEFKQAVENVLDST